MLFRTTKYLFPLYFVDNIRTRRTAFGDWRPEQRDVLRKEEETKIITFFTSSQPFDYIFQLELYSI